MLGHIKNKTQSSSFGMGTRLGGHFPFWLDECIHSAPTTPGLAFVVPRIMMSIFYICFTKKKYPEATNHLNGDKNHLCSNCNKMQKPKFSNGLLNTLIFPMTSCCVLWYFNMKIYCNWVEK